MTSEDQSVEVVIKFDQVDLVNHDRKSLDQLHFSLALFWFSKIEVRSQVHIKENSDHLDDGGKDKRVECNARLGSN